MKALEMIASYGIDTKSYVAAASDIRCQGDLDERTYRERITEMTMTGTTDTPIELLHIVYGYTIQEAVRNNELAGKALYEYATKCATDFYNSHRYIFVVREEEAKVDMLTGEVKKKKGAKGDIAREVFIENKDALRAGEVSRKEMLTMIADAADMSEAGASTYYAKLKKEYEIA